MRRRVRRNPSRRVVWGAIGAVGVWEAFWFMHRRAARVSTHAAAQAAAKALGRPLVTVGAPDLGSSSSPSGDIVVDIRPSTLPNSIVADICKPLPFATDSVVVFVSCVLEYVNDFDAALAELRRISGGHLYVVRVEPWTLSAYFYPGARRTISPIAPAPMTALAGYARRRALRSVRG